VLKAGNHKEITRSCPHESLVYYISILGTNATAKAGFPWEIVGITGAAAIAPVVMVSKEKIKSNTGTDDKFESKGVGAGVTGAAALGAADTNAVSSDASDEGIVEKESRPIIADDISAAVIIPATNVGDIEEA
jgi:hypothetical protein